MTILLRKTTRQHDTVEVVAASYIPSIANDLVEAAKVAARAWVGEPLPESGHRPRVEREFKQDGGLITGWWCERHNDFGIRRATIQIVGSAPVKVL